MESPKPPVRNKFGTKEIHKRYKEIKHWAFIPERRVQLLPEQYDPFLDGLQRQNWMRLAEPLNMYDPEVVYEFYANSWAGEEGTQVLRS